MLYSIAAPWLYFDWVRQIYQNLAQDLSVFTIASARTLAGLIIDDKLAQATLKGIQCALHRSKRSVQLVVHPGFGVVDVR